MQLFGHFFAHYNLGLAYSLAGDDVKAAEAYRRALALSPEFKEAREKLLEVESRIRQGKKIE